MFIENHMITLLFFIIIIVTTQTLNVIVKITVIMNYRNLIKVQSTPEDDYVSFMVYLRTNGVWKSVSNVFRMLNKTRPEDPIEFFKANVKIDNTDNRAIEETRRKIAEAEEKLRILRHDKLVLTANLDLLDKTIRLNRKPNSGVESTALDYEGYGSEMISETLSHSEHVSYKRAD